MVVGRKQAIMNAILQTSMKPTWSRTQPEACCRSGVRQGKYTSCHPVGGTGPLISSREDEDLRERRWTSARPLPDTLATCPTALERVWIAVGRRGKPQRRRDVLPNTATCHTCLRLDTPIIWRFDSRGLLMRMLANASLRKVEE